MPIITAHLQTPAEFERMQKELRDAQRAIHAAATRAGSVWPHRDRFMRLRPADPIFRSEQRV